MVVTWSYHYLSRLSFIGKCLHQHDPNKAISSIQNSFVSLIAKVCNFSEDMLFIILSLSLFEINKGTTKEYLYHLSQ